MPVAVLTLFLALLLHAGAALAGEEPGGADGGLPGVEWRWQESLYGNDTRAVPAAPDRYTLILGDGGVFQARADCNRASGGYRLDEHRLTLTLGPSTMAMCPPDSLDTAYLKDLAAVQSWMMHDGDLVLMLRYDTGTMRFSPGAF